MPEARIILAEAVVHVATAPKSNAAYTAIDAAIADVKAGKAGPVPAHLRDAHYAGAKQHGHGTGYRYAHDYPHGIAAQQYAPDELAGTTYYQPTALRPRAGHHSPAGPDPADPRRAVVVVSSGCHAGPQGPAATWGHGHRRSTPRRPGDPARAV